MFRWIHRPVKPHDQSRDEIARAVRAVRAVCFGRACLKECAKRMTAAAPLRRLRRGGAAFAVAALLLLGSSAWGVVTCTWNGSGYTCSGEGDVVEVIGGNYGGGGGSIVTNVVGVCTNCVAMSPEYVRNWKIDAKSGILDLKPFAEGIASDADYVISLLGAYTNTCEVSSFRGAYASGTSNLRIATNFLHSVGAFPGETPQNKAAALTQNTEFSGFGGNNDNYNRSRLSFYDGAAMAYNQIVNDALTSQSVLSYTKRSAETIAAGLDSLDFMVDSLSDEECTNQWDGASGGSGDEGGGGSTVVTNQVSGNWCTYDQGEAIKELLDDIKEWSERQANYLRAISNRVVSIDETIKNALFTSYTHIPTEEELQTSWQELYLTGSNPNFPGYASTNIVARIELLLAGISGVLTNVSDYASQDEFADESLDSTNLVENAMGDFTNQFVNVMQDRAASSRSVGDALVRLYQKFRTWSGTPFTTEYIINSYSVEFESGKAVDVPGFAAAAKTLPWANVIRVICRSARSVIWVLMTVAIFVRFQIAFFQWCFKYVKWAVEVLQGLFV